MAQNTAPIFVLTPKNWFVASGTSANTAMDGTGTVSTLVTAGADGSRVSKIRVVHQGTNVATVVRFFLNNGSTNAVASNNSLFMEQTMPANTLSQVAASTSLEIPVDISLAAGHKILVTIGTAIAAGLQVSAEGGDY